MADIIAATSVPRAPRRIVALHAENVKRLKVVDIRPDGALVEITGKNGNGKTSVLDAIWWAIAGKKNIQVSPIRQGQERALIRLDMGDLAVVRTFRAQDGGDYTTDVRVEAADGARYPHPQTILDRLYAELTLDPLEFARAEPARQLEMLKRFVSGFDFEAHARKRREAFELRTIVNRELKALEARLAGAAIVQEAQKPDVDIDALTEQLAEASTYNATIERRRQNRANLAADVRQAIGMAEGKIAEASELRRRAGELEAEAQGLKNAAKENQAKLDAAGPLPEPRDATALAAQLTEARRAAEAWERTRRDREAREQLAADVEAKRAESERLTDEIEHLDEQRSKAVAGAALPVSGIELTEDRVLLNGVPFEQASDAEQLSASVAIAAAAEPELRVIRIRDGSLLDDDAMLALAKFAEARDFQIWIERVDSSGKIGVVLEDGMVKGQEAEPLLPIGKSHTAKLAEPVELEPRRTARTRAAPAPAQTPNAEPEL